MTEPTMIPHSPYAAYDPRVMIYDVGFQFGRAYPLEYTGWKDEVLSWKETCYLHAGLNPTYMSRVAGPDATKLFNRICVNNIERIEVGRSTHAIMCSPGGYVMAHGMLQRLAEDEYLTFWLDPVVMFHAMSGEFDVTWENLTDQRFLLQLAGPRSLEVLEAALGEDFHDLRFLGHRPSEIGGRTIGVSQDSLSVMRIGMAGTLAYEVHGHIDDAVAVYEALVAAGEPFGLRRLGSLSYYPMNHTENGFPNLVVHFPFAYADDPQFAGFLRGIGAPGIPISADPGGHDIPGFVPTGSMGDDWRERYVTPFDLGWGHLVKLDHDFIGREALEPLKEAPPRQMVTLEWNVDDLLDTFRSHFEPGEEYKLMDFPADARFSLAGRPIHNDQVVKDGRRVGMSMGRMYSYYYRRMLSICPIDVELAEIGTEVTIVWGESGARQKEIRATVARYPYLDLERNERVDVQEIPAAS